MKTSKAGSGQLGVSSTAALVSEVLLVFDDVAWSQFSKDQRIDIKGATNANKLTAALYSPKIHNVAVGYSGAGAVKKYTFHWSQDTPLQTEQRQTETFVDVSDRIRIVRKSDNTRSTTPQLPSRTSLQLPSRTPLQLPSRRSLPQTVTKRNNVPKVSYKPITRITGSKIPVKIPTGAGAKAPAPVGNLETTSRQASKLQATPTSRKNYSQTEAPLKNEIAESLFLCSFKMEKLRRCRRDVPDRLKYYRIPGQDPLRSDSILHPLYVSAQPAAAAALTAALCCADAKNLIRGPNGYSSAVLLISPETTHTEISSVATIETISLLKDIKNHLENCGNEFYQIRTPFDMATFKSAKTYAEKKVNRYGLVFSRPLRNSNGGAAANPEVCNIFKNLAVKLLLDTFGTTSSIQRKVIVELMQRSMMQPAEVIQLIQASLTEASALHRILTAAAAQEADLEPVVSIGTMQFRRFVTGIGAYGTNGSDSE